MRFVAQLSLFFVIFFNTKLYAQFSSHTPLLSPLSLQYALSLAGKDNSPEVQIAISEQLLLLSKQDLFQSNYNFKVGIYGQLAAVKPSQFLPAIYKNNNTDHELFISVNKRLYDFGRKSNQMEASNNLLNASSMQLISRKKVHYLQILQAFFNVILADLDLAYQNEALSVAYIAFDRAGEQFKLNRVSELELLRLETDFRAVSVEQAKSENAQLLKRSILAINLIMPDQIPADLEVPDLSAIPSFSIKRELPDIKQLYQKVIAHNVGLKEINYQITAEQKQQQAYYADKYPIISGDLQAAWYSREVGGSDRGVAALNIEIPLYQGGEVDSRIAASHALIYKLKALYTQLSMQLRQQVLQIWMQLQNLKKQYQQVQTALKYRNLYLDKSRSEYESELKSDLGSAMVFLSATQLNEKRILFEMAYKWAELDVLLAKEKLYGFEY